MERHLALMCRYQKQWAEVEALVCSRRVFTRKRWHEGIPVTEVGEWGRFQSAPISPLFPYYLKQLAGEVTVIHCPNPTAELSWLLTRPSSCLIVRYQSDVVRQASAMRFYAPFQMKFLKRADMILVASPQYLETSFTLKRLRERCRIVPLGIVPEEFEHPDLGRVAALREQYGGRFVLFSGRHRYYKGIDQLVMASAQIRARVVIAGDGPERERNQRLAQSLGVSVAFPGELNQKDLVDYLHACDVFVFPSVARSEAFGISMLEAHACGKPVVATRLGTGVEFVNLDGVTGLNVPPKDPDALAKAVNSLLDNSALRERMGEEAKRRVWREFRAEDIARREYELYVDVLTGRSS